MRRRRRRRRALLALVPAALATPLAGCGSVRHATTTPPPNTVPSGAPGTLRILPARPRTRSPIRFAFTAPVASGVHGNAEIGYSLSIVGTGGPGCVGAREASADDVARGATATITLGPAQLGRPWCPGAYAARAIELQRAHCRTGVPCPQYERVVAIVARAGYTVRR